jgi:hypothetical protein
MSGVNGDKSRFHRERKQKLARRVRNQKLYAGLVAPKAAASASKKPAVNTEEKVSA